MTVVPEGSVEARLSAVSPVRPKSKRRSVTAGLMRRSGEPPSAGLASSSGAPPGEEGVASPAARMTAAAEGSVEPPPRSVSPPHTS